MILFTDFHGSLTPFSKNDVLGEKWAKARFQG